LWLSVGRVGADLVSLVLFTVISRDLGPVATGQYSYAFALGVFVSIIAAAGIDQFGIRQYAQLGASADTAACWRNIVVAQLLQLLSGLALLVLAIVFLSARSASPIVTVELSVFLIGWSLSRTFFVPAIAREDMAAPAMLELASRSGASVIALALCLAGVRSLPIIMAAFPVAGVVLVGLAVRNARGHGARLTRGIRWKDVRATLKASLPFTVCEALGQFYMRADLLLIAQMLGSASAGWYSADLKMVEVGLMPLTLLGTATYPLLSRTAFERGAGFPRLSEEFMRIVLFVSGWLAVGMYCLLPLIIPALLGGRFEPSVGLLPLFAVLAVTKGLEVGLYRILYATGRQNTYMKILAVGTSLIVGLNLVLIPIWGITGAIAAVVAGNVVVDILAVVSLRSDLRPQLITMALTRLAAPLVATALVFAALEETELNSWVIALAACVTYPLCGVASGLIPHPRRSLLFA
jgi:O-antigen/teichoic acid export membrane protein